MDARADADIPIIGECDYVCKYGNASWTLHARSFSGVREQGGYPIGQAYGLRGDAAEGLDVLFPSGLFRAIVSRLDPVTLHWALRDYRSACSHRRTWTA